MNEPMCHMQIYTARWYPALADVLCPRCEKPIYVKSEWIDE